MNHHVDRQLFAGAVGALDQPAQRLAMDVLEGDVVARLDLAEVDDAGDVLVIQKLSDARFVLE